MVAIRTACSALTAVGSPPALCTSAAILTAPSRSSVLELTAPSVPRPTVTPASRSSGTRAMPQPSFRFDTGQRATAVPARASVAISASVRSTACASSVPGPSTPSESSSSTGRMPCCSVTIATSPAFSAACRWSRAPCSRASAAMSVSCSGPSVYAECAKTTGRVPAAGARPFRYVRAHSIRSA
ncbi:hypothetical protein SALBM135S_04801 [Streptomyces alboniger]